MHRTQRGSEVRNDFVAFKLVGSAELQSLQIDINHRVVRRRRAELRLSRLLRIQDFQLRVGTMRDIQDKTESARVVEFIGARRVLDFERSAKAVRAERRQFELDLVVLRLCR